MVVPVQKNALLTYLRRIYYPFMVRDPEVHTPRGIQCIIWVHQHPQVAGTQAARNVLGAAVVIDSLDHLPSALDAVEEVVLAACKYFLALWTPVDDDNFPLQDGQGRAEEVSARENVGDSAGAGSVESLLHCLAEPYSDALATPLQW